MVTRLRQGILMGCIAEAVHLAMPNIHESIVAFVGSDTMGTEDDWREHIFEDNTYVEDLSQGERWTVAFGDQGAVAVFYSNESDRNPHPPDSPPYDQDVYFEGMPDHLQSLKERALGWMLDFDFVVGGPNALITSAMWADGEQFTAAEPWQDVYHHSLWACAHQLLPPAAALEEWRSYFDFADQPLALVWSLYERQMASPDQQVMLTADERRTLRADRPGAANLHGAFAAAGIAYP